MFDLPTTSELARQLRYDFDRPEDPGAESVA
jgi:hypothetical protein